MFRNNLALGHIVNDVDAGSNEQKINKASSSNNIDLRIVFRIIDSLRAKLNLIYIQERQINPQSNPKGAGRKAYDICFMFKLLTIQLVLDCSDHKLIEEIKDRQSLRDLLGITVDQRLP